MDEERWITLSNKQHVLIDDTDGAIRAGMGGKFNGEKIDEIGGRERPKQEKPERDPASRHSDQIGSTGKQGRNALTGATPMESRAEARRFAVLSWAARWMKTDFARDAQPVRAMHWQIHARKIKEETHANGWPKGQVLEAAGTR